MLVPCLSMLQLLRIIQAAEYFYISEEANYEDARRLCQKHGLDLAKVTSDDDLDDVIDLYKIKDLIVLGLGVHYNGNSFDYSDGTPLLYDNWNKIYCKEPDHLDRDFCAVIIHRHKRWHTRHCGKQYPSLCGPIQSDDAYKVKVSSLKRWSQGFEFTDPPTHEVPQISLQSCAKDCAMQNCMYFSLDGTQCKMYSDDTSTETRQKKESAIWERK